MAKLLKPAEPEMCYLRAGFLGFAGSGKTRTATDLSIAVASKIGDAKPVAFLDTETGSDFMLQRFAAAGVEVLRAKSRSFADLKTFMDEAAEVASVALVDSITHFWVDLTDAYAKRKKLKRIEFHHWREIKAEWREFTDRYLNLPVHTIICGRAGFEYEYQEDEETGKKELIKAGTKMKAEGEFGFEPSLLVEMLRIRKSDATDNPSAKGFVHRAVVLKDRWDILNGAEIDNPTAEDFWPAIAPLNIGGVHVGVEKGSPTEELFGSPDFSPAERRRRTEIVLEKIGNLFVLNGLGGTAAGVKEKKLKTLQDFFGTTSWKQIEGMKLADLERIHSDLEAHFSGRSGEGDDSIPFDEERAPIAEH